MKINRVLLGTLSLAALTLTWAASDTRQRSPRFSFLRGEPARFGKERDSVIPSTYVYWFKADYPSVVKDADAELTRAGWRRESEGTWTKEDYGQVSISTSDWIGIAGVSNHLPQDWGPEYTVVVIDPPKTSSQINREALFRRLKYKIKNLMNGF
jgi:RimJ/RimL family protein N-acetyltransferase